MKKSKDSDKKTSLRDWVTSETNIFNAIHSLRSYVFEENLLTPKDIRLFHLLLDKFNLNLLKKTVRKCQERIIEILDNPGEFFKVSVYFRIKKYDDETKGISFRPMHCARLTEMICMAAMLQILMFEDETERKPSDLSKKLPDNFYGNRPSMSVDMLFEKWQEKYTEYNQEIIECSRRFRQSHEYKTEVTLDLQNFFPSIDPRFIINYCVKTLSGRYGNKNNDVETLTTLVEKLIYLEIDETNIRNWKEEYYDKTDISSDIYFTRGVAQGLPQSYFFGNLCMVEIRNVLKRPEMLEGKAMYYVDDSVIYIKEIFNNEKFELKINNLNEEVNKHINSFNLTQPNKPVSTAENFHKQFEYSIAFHPKGKSQYCHIDETGWNLNGLPRIVSGMGIYMLLDEIDQEIELDKLEALSKYVDNYLHILDIADIINSNPSATRTNKYDKELTDLCKKIQCDNDFDTDKFKSIEADNLNTDDLDAQKKLLKRYKKLFLYHIKTLKYKQDGSVTPKYDSFKKDFKASANEKPRDKKRWTDNDDKSRFRAEGRMLLRNLPQKEAYHLFRKVCRWEREIAGTDKEKSKNLYHQKDFRGILNLKNFIFNDYEGLEILMKLYYNQLRQTSMPNRIARLIEFIEDIEIFSSNKKVAPRNSRNYSPLFSRLPGFMNFAVRNSEEMKRRMLNAFFSFISEYEVSDSLMPVKAIGKPIPYSELRILAMLRNRRFSLQNFKHFIDTLEYNSLENRMAIDYGLTKILSEVVRYVGNPVWVDCVIQTHRITKGLWHNGSKFLNSYTLHNEEHAITLIEKSIDIVKKINYLSIKQADYFILFIACYLHDISMVIHPNLHAINDGSDKAKKLLSYWAINLKKKFDESKEDSDRLDENDHLNIYKQCGLMLIDIFEDVYKHFENKVRGTHATDSARFIIEKSKTLFNYLDPAMLSIIAHVGESHGYDISDVYGLKSKAMHDTISEKYLMMILRLADLHDVANDRIDYHLLKQNVWHMDNNSRFHWISHLVTDSIRLVPEYRTYFRLIEKKGKFDVEQYILENLKFELYLNVKCLSPIPLDKKFKKCSGIREISMTDPNENGKGSFTVKIGKGECTNAACPTICRWTMRKHEWLVKELEALNSYLNTVNTGMIRSQIELKIIFKDELDLEQDLFDDVINYLDEH